MTGAPLIANGVLITGMSGAEYGTRGFLDGWNPDTGEHLWRRYTIPGPGEKGHETWPSGDSYLHGGGSTWITGSYDPDLDLVYWGTGNAGPWNPVNRAGDNLYTASLLAFRPKTGEIVWHFQFTPNDMYDYDATWEPILAEIKVDGQVRKVVMQLNRNGFLYVLDRANGKMISAKPYEKVNWAKEIDQETGRPVLGEIQKHLLAESKSNCGRPHEERRTGRTPRSIRKPVCCMPTRSTWEAFTNSLRRSSFHRARITPSPRITSFLPHPASRSDMWTPSIR